MTFQSAIQKPELDLAALEAAFNKTKGQLFFKKGSGFLGPLLCTLKFKWEDRIQTACISADTLYWNPHFFLSLDEDTRVTVLAHELWHNGFLHGARIGNRDPELWNEAADHTINLMLKEHGYYMAGFPYLMDPQFSGMATDEVYDILSKNQPPQPQGNPQGQPGQGDDEDGEGQSPVQGHGQDGLGKDMLPVSAKEQSDAVARVTAASQIARMTGRPGDVPGEITVTIDRFLNPKLPWETLLFNFFNELTTQEYSFARPNRRYSDPIVPGVTGRNGLEHLIYYLDISGSISDEQILRFNSEVKYIKDVLDPELLTLVTFDTVLQDEYVFEKDDPFEKIVVTGRGGTDLEDVFAHAQKHQPTAMVVFSDLCVDIPPDPGIPVLWICCDSPNQEAPPFGRMIHLES